MRFPVEANSVFLSLPRSVYDQVISRGWRFYNFFEPDLYRLMCSWATTEESLVALVEAVGAATAV